MTTGHASPPAAFAGDIVEAADASRILPDWAGLARRAADPNPFYTPTMGVAGIAHLAQERRARLLLAWRDSGEGRHLVGLLPLVKPRGRYWNPLSVMRAASLYGTLSTPLLDAECAPDALLAMLATAEGNGIKALLLPFVAEDGPAAAALGEVARRRDLPISTVDGHKRAFLRSDLSGADYIKATLETRRRKEADRQRRRLAEEGSLSFTVATDEADAAAELECFLDLEEAGWKGRAGTALKQAPGAADFIRAAAREGARNGTFRVASLRVGKRLVAAGLVAIAGRRAYYTKTAYDEALARFSPGLLLTLDLTSHLLDDPAIDDADSIAVADHPMIDRIWTARCAISSLVVGTRPGGEPAVAAAAGVERWRESLVERVKHHRAAIQNRIGQLRRVRRDSAKDATTKASDASAV